MPTIDEMLPIAMPPLRERREDIPLLVDHFLAQLNKDKAPPNHLPVRVREALESYNWPGNVRELENAIERALILHPDGPLQFEDLSGVRRTHGEGQGRPSAPEALGLNEVIKRLLLTACFKIVVCYTLSQCLPMRPGLPFGQ